MAEGRHLREDARHIDRQPNQEPKPKKDRPKLRFLRTLGIVILVWIGLVMFSELGKASGVDETESNLFVFIGGFIFLFIIIASIFLHQFFRFNGRGLLDRIFNRNNGVARPPQNQADNPD